MINAQLCVLYIVMAFVAGSLLGRFGRLCKHKWVEVSRTFVDPCGDSSSMYWVSYKNRDKYIAGFTTILLRCEHCDKLCHEELLGHVHEPKVVPLRRVN